ncbi:MAG: peptide ABC transporter substrate-binding protein, partial [Alphaproteobacteria bacterium]
EGLRSSARHRISHYARCSGMRVTRGLTRLVPAVLSVAILVLSAASGAAARDRLVIGITQYPSTFHPNIDSMLAKSYVLGMARRPVTVYDADWDLVCMLCTDLPTIENGAAVPTDLPGGGRGIAVTYTLQPEARWGDGTPVSTDDVLFTWEVGRHPRTGIANSELYRRILSIDARDAKTFTVLLDRIEFRYNALNDFGLLPAHLERPVFEQDPETYRNRTLYDTDTANPGLYFGPYRIVEAVAGSHVALEPNPTWWGEAPAFGRIVVRILENTAALEANLLSGAIDYIAGELGLALDQALALERRRGRDFDIVFKPGLVYEHVDLNLDNPILADRRVRQALLLALDRQTLTERLFDGRQSVATSFVSPLDAMHGEDLPDYPHDPQRAAALLDEAGWSAMRQGVRHDAEGRRLSLELMTTAGNRTRELVQQVLQGQWKAVGVEVRISNQPARVFFGETMSKRRYPAMGMYAWLSAPESVPRTTQHSSMIPTAENGWSGQNYPAFRNARTDALIDAIEIELDREARRTMWQELQEIYLEELPVLPLYFRSDSYVKPKWLKGVEPTGHQYPTTLWVERWHAE